MTLRINGSVECQASIDLSESVFMRIPGDPTNWHVIGTETIGDRANIYLHGLNENSIRVLEVDYYKGSTELRVYTYDVTDAEVKNLAFMQNRSESASEVAATLKAMLDTYKVVQSRLAPLRSRIAAVEQERASLAIKHGELIDAHREEIAAYYEDKRGLSKVKTLYKKMIQTHLKEIKAAVREAERQMRGEER